MIPKQTPACNFRPATLPQTSLFSSLPLAPPRKSASSSSLIRPLCVQSKALNRNRLRRQGAPRRLLSCTARVIFRPAFPQGLSREGKLCAYHLPLETYGFQTAQRDMMTCIAKKREARFGASLRSVSGGIRTRDLQSRSLTRYPAALQTQSTLLLYLVLRRRARPSFIPACSG